MKSLYQENLKELTEKVLDLIALTSVEIGHRTDAKTLATLSKIFATDLIRERRFGKMTFNQVEDAFHQGVRFGKDEPFLNIRTFYKWFFKFSVCSFIINFYITINNFSFIYVIYFHNNFLACSY